jgi:hypothetical protein
VTCPLLWLFGRVERNQSSTSTTLSPGLAPSSFPVVYVHRLQFTGLRHGPHARLGCACKLYSQLRTLRAEPFARNEPAAPRILARLCRGHARGSTTTLSKVGCVVVTARSATLPAHALLPGSPQPVCQPRLATSAGGSPHSGTLDSLAPRRHPAQPYRLPGLLAGRRH